MKAKLIGAALLGATLAACGGKASFTVGGTITGLGNQGLVLQNSGGNDLAVAAGATTFGFANQIDYGTEYNVTIKSQPAHMTCTVANPTGSAGRTTVINVVISCAQNTYTLGGTVVGYTGEGLVLVNGSSSGTIPIVRTAADFPSFSVFPAIPVGTAYGLAVLTQPTKPAQFCTIANGSGVMGDGDVRNVVVTCQ